MKRKPLDGQTFGRWKVMKLADPDKRGKNSRWHCICECGIERAVCRTSLTSGDSRSCGCLKNPKPEMRIKNYISIDKNQCWNWTRKLRKDGYGRMFYIDAYMPAHRASYQIFRRKVPRNKLICHRCDNRRCVNPDHLYIGTYKDNALDMVKRNRQNLLFGEKHQNSKFKNDEIKEMRNKFENGKNIRQLSLEYKSGYKTMWKIIRRKTWKHI